MVRPFVLFNLMIPVVSYLLYKHVAITNRNCLPFPEQPSSLPVFLCDSRSSIFSLICSVLSNIVCLFVWLLYCLSFFCSRLLVTPVLSSNLSYLILIVQTTVLSLDKWDLCKTGILNVHSWAIKVVVNWRFWINYIMM